MRTEDGYIIDKCLNGDPAAFGLLVDKYKASIYALAYAKLGNFHDAEDLTQEVFLKAYQKLATLKRWDKFLAWLYAITSNLCKNFLRSKSSHPDREYLTDQGKERLEDLSMGVYREGRMCESLHEALASLPETHRQVLTLYYLGGMSCKAIAEFLGTSPHAIEMRLSRARSKLKAALSPDPIGEEMIAMMSTTFDQQKLQPAFTLRLVEMIKRTKIQPGPRTPAIPVGLSVTGVLMAAFLSLTVPFSPLYPIGTLIGSALPAETQVAEVGVIPVDTVEITEITILSSEKGDADFGQRPKPNRPMRAFAPGKWNKRADMPTARIALSTPVVDEKIYAIGGAVLPGLVTPVSKVEEYDSDADVWTRKANMPTARYGLSTAVVNGKIYAIGGWDASRVFRTVEMYDPVTDTWTKKADIPTARYGLSTAVVISPSCVRSNSAMTGVSS